MANAVATLTVKAVADVKGATSGLDEVASRSDKMKKGLGTAAKVATGVLVGLGAAFVSAGRAAAEDAQGAALLAQSLTKTTGATKDQIAGVEDWISSLTLATGVADDQLRPALATLSRATGDVTKSQDALKVALDVSAATGADVESVSKAIAKGYAGQTTAIGRLVPGIDKAVLASGDMNKVMAELKAKTGGAAAAAADTTAGKMQRMTVAFAEAKESLGAGLLPAMTAIAGVLLTVATAAGKHPKLFTAIAVAVAVLAAGIIALNLAVTIYTAVTTLAASATIAAWVAALGPILLVVAAIALVVGAVILLWKKSETFRTVVTAVWNAVRKVAVTAFAAIKAAGLAVFSWLKANWPLLLAILTGPIGIAVALIAKNWDKIKAGAQSVKDRIDTIWQNLKAVIVKPFDLARSAVDHVSTAVSSLIGWIGKIVKPIDLAAPFNLAKSAIDHVISAVSSLIGWLGKIKVPKINLPHIPGTSRAAPAPTVRGFAAPAVPTARTSSSSSSMIVVNVTGAVDPEATARQIRRILNGHTRRVGLAS